jgi:hypothetical protein
MLRNSPVLDSYVTKKCFKHGYCAKYKGKITNYLFWMSIRYIPMLMSTIS